MTITLPEPVYQKFAHLAESRSMTVEQYLETLLPSSEEELGPPPGWRDALAEIQRQAEARAHRYPPGFQVDDSRDTIYREREDRQL